MEQQYLTKERLEALKQELEVYKTTRRIEVADRLKRAKELGDLSENSEYSEARDEQALVESKIIELDNLIRTAKIITADHGGSAVQVGSSVVLEKDKKEIKYSIVGSNEARPEDGFISNESPLGKALIGKKVGDTATLKLPNGEVSYKIKNIH